MSTSFLKVKISFNLSDSLVADIAVTPQPADESIEIFI